MQTGTVQFHRLVFAEGPARRLPEPAHEFSERFRQHLGLLEQTPGDVDAGRLEEFMISRLRAVRGVEQLLGPRGAALLHRSRTLRHPDWHLSRTYARSLYDAMLSIEGLPSAGSGNGALTEEQHRRHDGAMEQLHEDIARAVAHARAQHRVQEGDERQPLPTTYVEAIRTLLMQGDGEWHAATKSMLVFLLVQKRVHLLPRIAHYLALLDDRIHVRVTTPLDLNDEQKRVVAGSIIREYERETRQQRIAARMRFSYHRHDRQYNNFTQQILQQVLNEQVARLTH